MSVQGTFVLIDRVDATDPDRVKHVPSHLLGQVRDGSTPVRTYNIVTPCTIEAWRPAFGDDSPNRGLEQPIRCVMTTYGYILPYPKGLRFAVWFTGGSLEMDGHKNEKWFQIFDKDTAATGSAPKRNWMETGKYMAARLLMGASSNDTLDDDGRLSYTLSRPMASHIDLLYLDPRMQIFRGSSGTVYVHVRIPGSRAVHDCVRSDHMLPSTQDPCQGDEEEEDDDDDGDDCSSSSDEGERDNTRDPAHAAPIVSVPVLARPSAQRLRKIASESNLNRLCSSAACDASSCEPENGPARTIRKTRSCLKRTSSYETPSRAWYLNSNIA